MVHLVFATCFAIFFTSVILLLSPMISSKFILLLRSNILYASRTISLVLCISIILLTFLPSKSIGSFFMNMLDFSPFIFILNSNCFLFNISSFISGMASFKFLLTISLSSIQNIDFAFLFIYFILPSSSTHNIPYLKPFIILFVSSACILSFCIVS